MTSHWTYFYVCPNGHEAKEHLSENDQPFSTNWERRSYHGVKVVDDVPTCDICKLPMKGTSSIRGLK